MTENISEQTAEDKEKTAARRERIKNMRAERMISLREAQTIVKKEELTEQVHRASTVEDLRGVLLFLIESARL